ncbi:MAG TPA: BNR-4 repeat-containing protein [Pirellulales bacterium]|nr:BNR-4 repeat-containing protein [Pirellulales bacterium]
MVHRCLFVGVCCWSLIAVGMAADSTTPEPERPKPSDQPKDVVAGKLVVFNDNGAWCWYQDKRVIVDPVAGTMLIGSVANKAGMGGEPRHGNIDSTVYDIAAGSSQLVVLHEHQEADDHDAPAFLIRPDGRYLAVYTKHNHDTLTRWRVSTNPHDALHWGDEQTFDWSLPPASIGSNFSTYSNLFYLPVEKRTYDFVRSVNRDPSFLVSTDDGSTWSYGGKLLTDNNVGYVDGYVKYVSNGQDRIDFITTEHHPRDFNNSIYHGYVKDGKLHRSDGTVVNENIFDLNSKAPPAHELTTVLAANTQVDGEKMTHCWDADLALDSEGRPCALLTCRANDDPENSNFNDHRFFYARFDGQQWQTHQLAKGGARLWEHEQDYIGGGSLDPDDPSVLYISVPIDPRDNTPLTKHEIFKGQTTDGGAAWLWTPITQNSSVDNLRPIVRHWNPGATAVLWLRGNMRRSQDYDMQVVGVIDQKQ